MDRTPPDTRTAAEIAAAGEARASAFGGSSSVQDVPQGTLTAADAAELAALRAERARAAGTPSVTPAAAPSSAGITITEDRLQAIIAQAIATGRREAARAGGARPETAEETHEQADAAQAAVEGDCTHPLSAHEFFGADGYGKCHADGCKCTGRELGSAAIRTANAKAKEKTQAPSSQAQKDAATLADPYAPEADRRAAAARRDAAAAQKVAA